VFLPFFPLWSIRLSIKGNVTTWINHYLSIEFYVSVDWWLRHYWASLRDFSFVLLSFTGLRCLITSAHVPLHRAPHGIIREQYQQLALSEWVLFYQLQSREARKCNYQGGKTTSTVTGTGAVVIHDITSLTQVEYNSNVIAVIF
jgi:hypothetical protein